MSNSTTIFGANSNTVRRAWILVVALGFMLPAGQVRAVSKDSPEVLELVNLGLKTLDKKGHEQLGGKCLIGLCYLKAPEKNVNHARVKEALAACQATASKGNVDDYVTLDDAGVYSNGLAVIFLCELDATKYKPQIQFFLSAIQKRQKAHGGWGYNAMQTGDTSQTQYGALAFWEAHRRGFAVDPSSVERLANWLTKVQDPSGGWAYQGVLSTTSQRVPQPQSDITCSRVSACMGSALICADLFGILQGAPEDPSTEDALPSVFEEATVDSNDKSPPLNSSTLDRLALFQTIKLGDDWMTKNYKVDMGHYNCYYMYALERYRSFQEVQTGERPEEPDWYNKGYAFLKEAQVRPGVWEEGCGEEIDTAFAILFLLRSTQKAILQDLGEGTLLAGRGLPTNLSKVKLKNGELVVEQAKTQVSDLIGMLDDESNLDDLVKDDSALVVSVVDEASARRLQQVIRSGSPQARILAVRALSRTGSLDYVPTMIYALTDPDRRVVLEADTGLRFISRKFAGFGLTKEFTDRHRFDVIDRWKTWFRGLRPDVQIPTE